MFFTALPRSLSAAEIHCLKKMHRFRPLNMFQLGNEQWRTLMITGGQQYPLPTMLYGSFLDNGGNRLLTQPPPFTATHILSQSFEIYPLQTNDVSQYAFAGDNGHMTQLILPKSVVLIPYIWFNE
jgi:hypothetical protein